MKLHFLGATYEHTELQLKAEDDQVTGTYRGLPLTIHRHQVKCRHKSLGTEMAYRGIHYKYD